MHKSHFGRNNHNGLPRLLLQKAGSGSFLWIMQRETEDKGKGDVKGKTAGRGKEGREGKRREKKGREGKGRKGKERKRREGKEKICFCLFLLVLSFVCFCLLLFGIPEPFPFLSLVPRWEKSERAWELDSRSNFTSYGAGEDNKKFNPLWTQVSPLVFFFFFFSSCSLLFWFELGFRLFVSWLCLVFVCIFSFLLFVARPRGITQRRWQKLRRKRSKQQRL